MWFHVDKLSSAHIYLRMQDGQSWEDLPQDLLMDLAQLTKANSIEGNKKDNITIIYTPWSNLKKDGSMDVGQVTFHNQRKVKRVLVPARENPIVNRLNKTKVERKPDLKEEKEDRQKELRKRDQASMQQRVSPITCQLFLVTVIRRQPRVDCGSKYAMNSALTFEQKKEEVLQAKEWKEKKYQKDHAYDTLFTDDNMAASSNQERGEDWEDDFM